MSDVLPWALEARRDQIDAPGRSPPAAGRAGGGHRLAADRRRRQRGAAGCLPAGRCQPAARQHDTTRNRLNMQRLCGIAQGTSTPYFTGF